MDSQWSPHTCHGVNRDSIRSPSGVYQEFTRSPYTLSGVHQEYQDFIRTPDGVHQDAWGSVTYRFLVMGVVVEFGCGKGSGMECNRMDFTIRERNGENCGNSIV